MSTLQDTITPLVGETTVPGAVALVANRAGVTDSAVAGVADPATGKAMTRDAVFQIASMSKAVTSVAAMQLVEEGRITLDEPVAPHLPHLADDRVLTGFDEDGRPVVREAALPVTLRHLLSHTSGLGYGFLSTDMQRAQGEVVPGSMASLKTPLLFDPGERWEYSIGTDWTGQVIEALTGKTLGAVFKERIFDPLGMADTGFDSPAADRRAALQLKMGRTFAPMPVEVGGGPEKEFESGGGGLYSTADDYMRFVRMLLNGGTLDGERILGEATLAEMSRNQIGSLRAGRLESVIPQFGAAVFDQFPEMDTKFGLGFLINPEPGPDGRSPGSLAWAGIANSYYWFDPAADVCGVVMMQFLPFGDSDAMALYGALERHAYRG